MRCLCFGLIVVASLIAPRVALAQLPQATLNWVFPPGAVVGATSEVTVAGSDLDEPAALLFSDARISARPKPGTANQFQVVVPSDVPEEIMDVRFVGRFGASNPRAFAVGRRPEHIAASTNTSAASAIDLPLESTVNARINPSAAAWFRFAASADQRIFIRVAAQEIDSRLVPNIIVSDAKGRELVVSRRREWLDFTAPADGEYLLSIGDQTFRGGDDFFFRLTLCLGPQLDFAQPNILRTGETNKVTLFGRNLPGSTPSAMRGADGKALERLSLEIVAPTIESSHAEMTAIPRKPAGASIFEETFAWSLGATNGSSNPLLFTLTTNDVVAGEPNQLSEVTPPIEFSGIFPHRGKISGVTFRANKGDVFWLELFADRLGFPSDPHAVVRRVRSTKGERGEILFADVLELGDTDSNLGDREFNTSTRDAMARFEAPQDGTYEVLVRDLYNLGETRPRYPYHLSLRRELPDFRLVSFPMPPTRIAEDRKVQVLPATLRREQTTALRVIAFRRDGFNGDIEFTGASLPPGLHVAPTRIGAGQNVGMLLISASIDANTVSNAVIVGTASIGPGTISRRTALASVLWPVADFNNENADARLHRDSVISVIVAETAPVSIAATATNAFEVPAEGKLVLPLSILRRGEFQAAFSLKPAGHPALDKAKEIAVPEKSTNLTAEINLAEAKMPPGPHTLWLQGNVAGKYRNNPEALVLAEAELQVAEKALASISESEKPKAEERKKAAEAAKKAAEDKAKPRDVNLTVYSQPFVVTVLPATKAEEKK